MSALANEPPIIAPMPINNMLKEDPLAIAPSDEDNNIVRMGFRDFDQKRFDAAEREFDLAITRWAELHRPRDEIVSLLKARANVLVDNKKFDAAIKDYDEALKLMSSDGEKEDGSGRYPEYPDTFVGRALAFEGLGLWERALADYNKAISLWGGGRGDGVNPYVLTFRGNTLGKLDRLEEAVEDYRAAGDIFLSQRDIDRYSDAKANLALALYGLEKYDESIKAMKDVLRKNNGYADMHVALAADLWNKGEYISAIKQWDFTCNEISVGCDKYSDLDWVSKIRRWPTNLVGRLEAFLERKVPQNLLDSSQKSGAGAKM